MATADEVVAETISQGLSDLLAFIDGGPGAELGEDARKALAGMFKTVVAMQDREQVLVKELKTALERTKGG